MKAYYKVYGVLKDQNKELFSVELEPFKGYILGRDPNSEENKLQLIKMARGKEEERKELPLRNKGVSRYDPKIGKEGSVFFFPIEDGRGVDIFMHSPSTITYPVLLKYGDRVIGVPLDDELSLRRFTGVDRNFTGEIRYDLFIYYISPFNYIGSIVVSDS
jgi:hypothetical protein